MSNSIAYKKKMIKLKSLLAPLIYVENDIHTPKEKNGEMKLLPLTTSVVLKKIHPLIGCLLSLSSNRSGNLWNDE